MVTTKSEWKAQIDDILSGITIIDAQIVEFEELFETDFSNKKAVMREINRLNTQRSVALASLAIPTAQYTITAE